MNTSRNDNTYKNKREIKIERTSTLGNNENKNKYETLYISDQHWYEIKKTKKKLKSKYQWNKSKN